jgi:small-conductance mechanosensitive channel
MFIYLWAVSAIGVLFLTRILYKLASNKRLRLREIEDQKEWEAIRVEQVKLDSKMQDAAKSAALKRVDARFSVTRRLVVPMIVLGTAALASLPFLDAVPAASLSLIVGGLTLIFGIAARPVIENAVAGLMISYSRTINIGDTVKLAGHYGTIEDISSTHTTIKIWNWNRYLVPNAKMLSHEFENQSLNDDLIWAHVEFIVGYDADLTVVEDVAKQAVESSDFALRNKSHKLWYSELKSEGVVCWVAGWASTPSNAWSLQHEIRRGLVCGFQAKGIAIRSHRVQLETEPFKNFARAL